MIARHEMQSDKTDVWTRLAAPLPEGVVAWRQDGKPITRDGKFFARFVAYIEANTVRERLDAVVPGEWDLTLELLPPLPGMDDGQDAGCSFKARLQILGVIRADVGTGRDYKAAATDAFKRAAVRFGIAHELYSYEQNWVQVDSDSKFAKPVEDPQTAYSRRWGSAPVIQAPTPKARRAAAAEAAAGKAVSNGAMHEAPVASASVEHEVVPATATAPVADAPAVDIPSCPKCNGRMWDNRVGKRNPKAPDFKCRDRSCDGVIWPPREVAAKSNGRGAATAEAAPVPTLDPSPLGAGIDTDDIPF